MDPSEKTDQHTVGSQANQQPNHPVQPTNTNYQPITVDQQPQAHINSQHQFTQGQPQASQYQQYQPMQNVQQFSGQPTEIDVSSISSGINGWKRALGILCIINAPITVALVVFFMGEYPVIVLINIILSAGFAWLGYSIMRAQTLRHTEGIMNAIWAWGFMLLILNMGEGTIGLLILFPLVILNLMIWSYKRKNNIKDTKYAFSIK